METEAPQEKSIIDDSMTEEQLAEIIQKVVGTTPVPDEKHNVFTFLTNIAVADDTTKIGNLKEEELGMPSLPVRSDKSLALWSGEVMDNPFFEKFFSTESEITTSTSLSRDGFLPKLGVLQKREIADVTKKQKQNKGWFKPKEKEEE